MAKKELKTYKIEKGTFTATNYVGIKFNNLAHEKVTPELFSDSYARLMSLGFENGEKNPSAIFYKWDTENNTSDLAIVLSVKDKPKQLPKGFELMELPTSKCFYIDYFGKYEDMEQAHAALSKYLIDNDLGENYIAIEEYVSDPEKEPNPMKWLTKISYLEL